MIGIHQCPFCCKATLSGCKVKRDAALYAVVANCQILNAHAEAISASRKISRTLVAIEAGVEAEAEAGLPSETAAPETAAPQTEAGAEAGIPAGVEAQLVVLNLIGALKQEGMVRIPQQEAAAVPGTDKQLTEYDSLLQQRKKCASVCHICSGHWKLSSNLQGLGVVSCCHVRASELCAVQQ